MIRWSIAPQLPLNVREALASRGSTLSITRYGPPTMIFGLTFFSAL